MTRGPSSRLLAPAVLLIGGAAVLALTHTRGWYPHDEGSLGQSALRLLGGEWPHRDFDEIYTLALTLWHALWFKLVGVSMATTRLALVAVALPWLFLLYRLSLRFVGPWAAAGIAATALVWSLPVYPASMPSWYLLFGATAAAWATIRWQEKGRLRWIFAAGLLGGLSVLFKLSGVLVIAGVGLAVVTALIGDRDDSTAEGAGMPLRLLALPLLAVMLLLVLGPGRGGAREFLRFSVPLLLLLGSYAIVVLRSGGRLPLRRLAPLAVLAAGAALPVVALLLLYVGLDALPALVDGVLISPLRRVAHASKVPPSPEVLELALPMLLLFLLPSVRPRWSGPVARIGGVFFAVILIGAGFRFTFYRYGWYAAWGMLFVVALSAAWQALQGTARDDARRRWARTLACVAVGLALIEYPFASAIYVIYSLPLVFLAAAALARSSGLMHRWAQGVALAFFLAFGALRILPGGLDGLAMYYAPTEQTARLALPRAGITVSPADSARYTAVISFVQDLAAGREIWAGPDAPEIYFLSGMPNHTRTFFDFFDADSIAAVPLPERLAARGVSVVVLNERPSFSAPLDSSLRRALARAYPQERKFPGFEVRWR